ncbi:biotin-dependent carboxyltransferase family protein [Pseudomonas sp. MWU13-2105]|uniref:5-oxoprolinase subunit C family protein n=1 Tax=Pseudomonas sp. MWU13-2105 TaxID=2935074 RepID=UPI00200EEC06|nr:biotin-dependent carboxyltransferase family protein [Pseudomonas sp. MWU13-2105]
MIEILSTGVLNSVQDPGRVGYLSIGVGQSGAMDSLALAMGNALLGNEASAAGLEIALFPFRLRILSDCRFAVTGAEGDTLLDEQPLPPQWARNGKAGQTLLIKPPRRGARCYVSFAGGIEVPLVMGSRATDLKTGFGGFEGRGLMRGDCLVPGSQDCKPRSGVGAALPWFLPELGQVIEIRVLPAAELYEFDESTRALFFQQAWTLSQEANRMGMRLIGPELKTRRPLELLSHGILPGTVQVPPSGQPIIQLADANTCGGYPKIANVIDADLWRLAQAPIGSIFRFVEVDHPGALAAQEHQDRELMALRQAMQGAFSRA